MNVQGKQYCVCVVGLGYVGLPLALAFSRHFRVIGFDSNPDRVKELDRHRNDRLTITSDSRMIRNADFAIICVPTPVTKHKEPDLTCIIDAAKSVEQNLYPGCTVILESTVYPGVTEQVVQPILESYGYKPGRDFRLGYSPERVNPGDDEHAVDRIVKVVSGMDSETTDLVTELYGTICPATFRAKSIQVAEMAKAIENTQRDINIALMNELRR